MSTGWDDPATRTLQMLLNGAWVGHESVLLVLHGGAERREGDACLRSRA